MRIFVAVETHSSLRLHSSIASCSSQWKIFCPRNTSWLKSHRFFALPLNLVCPEMLKKAFNNIRNRDWRSYFSITAGLIYSINQLEVLLHVETSLTNESTLCSLYQISYRVEVSKRVNNNDKSDIRSQTSL